MSVEKVCEHTGLEGTGGGTDKLYWHFTLHSTLYTDILYLYILLHTIMYFVQFYNRSLQLSYLL